MDKLTTHDTVPARQGTGQGCFGIQTEEKRFFDLGKHRKGIQELGIFIPKPSMSIRPHLGDEYDDFVLTTTGIMHADNERKGID